MPREHQSEQPCIAVVRRLLKQMIPKQSGDYTTLGMSTPNRGFLVIQAAQCVDSSAHSSQRRTKTSSARTFRGTEKISEDPSVNKRPATIASNAAKFAINQPSGVWRCQALHVAAAFTSEADAP